MPLVRPLSELSDEQLERYIGAADTLCEIADRMDPSLWVQFDGFYSDLMWQRKKRINARAQETGQPAEADEHDGKRM